MPDPKSSFVPPRYEENSSVEALGFNSATIASISRNGLAKIRVGTPGWRANLETGGRLPPNPV